MCVFTSECFMLLLFPLVSFAHVVMALLATITSFERQCDHHFDLITIFMVMVMGVFISDPMSEFSSSLSSSFCFSAPSATKTRNKHPRPSKTAVCQWTCYHAAWETYREQQTHQILAMARGKRLESNKMGRKKRKKGASTNKEGKDEDNSEGEIKEDDARGLRWIASWSWSWSSQASQGT